MEKSKYGWFWECPNGERCIYRHALPNGYVLKRDKKKLEDKGEEISLVDLIESERNALGSHTVSFSSNISNNLLIIIGFHLVFTDQSHARIVLVMEEAKDTREER